MRGTLAALLLLVSTAHAGGCPESADTASFVAPGTFGVGVRTLTLVDTTRPTPGYGTTPELPQRTLPTEVWYPATPPANELRDAPLGADGPYPLVVHSPGLLDDHRGEAYYARHLASRGFVVAIIDFPRTGSSSIAQPDLTDVQRQPGDVSFVIDQLLAMSAAPGGWLAGGIDAKRIGVSGLSLGGATTALVTFHPRVRDKRIRAALAMAPALVCAANRRLFRVARTPFLVIHGDQDLLVPLEANAGNLFRLSRSPRELVVLKNGTHVAFAGFPFPPADTSYDASFGCSLLVDVGEWGDPFAGLGGPRFGLEAVTARCAPPCSGPVPTNAPMLASRQRDLTVAVGAAFFEATLGRSAAARCFLRRTLAAENTDLEVRRRGGG